MTWWDEDNQCYRSTLVHKLFYVWGWPVIRFCMFRFLKPGQAHYFAMHFGLRFEGAVDRVWRGVVLVVVVLLLAGVRLLLFLPWFRFDAPTAVVGEQTEETGT